MNLFKCLLNLLIACCLQNVVYYYSDASKEAFEDWKKHDDAQDNFCEIEGSTVIHPLVGTLS